MGSCHLVIEPEPQSGVRNMALDEALLENAIERGECTLRWYRWQSATVSLGYFQNAADAAAISRLANLPMVRRLSGGGAILHHHEWTYSCTTPADHLLAATPGRIYELVHESIGSALAARGIPARLRGEARPKQEGTFLCFGRGDARDIVLDNHKVVGSAQRRRRGAVLQHGSLLLRRSEHAPEFPGLLDLVPELLVDQKFIHEVSDRITSVFGAAAPTGTHLPAVENRAYQLETRYRSLEWKHLRPIAKTDGPRPPENV